MFCRSVFHDDPLEIAVLLGGALLTPPRPGDKIAETVQRGLRALAIITHYPTRCKVQ
jgi:hypothetical protein